MQKLFSSRRRPFPVVILGAIPYKIFNFKEGGIGIFGFAVLAIF